MVNPGSCNTIEKIKNIENSGGHLAIIISEKDDNIGGIFMSDEGAGYDISIPAVLISNTDGKKLVAYYLNHADSHEDIKEIKLEIKFENENRDNTVYQRIRRCNQWCVADYNRRRKIGCPDSYGQGSLWCAETW